MFLLFTLLSALITWRFSPDLCTAQYARLNSRSTQLVSNAKVLGASDRKESNNPMVQFLNSARSFAGSFLSWISGGGGGGSGPPTGSSERLIAQLQDAQDGLEISQKPESKNNIFFSIPVIFEKPITAPNIVYGLTQGEGIVLSGDEQATPPADIVDPDVSGSADLGGRSSGRVNR